MQKRFDESKSLIRERFRLKSGLKATSLGSRTATPILSGQEAAGQREIRNERDAGAQAFGNDIVLRLGVIGCTRSVR